MSEALNQFSSVISEFYTTLNESSVIEVLKSKGFEAGQSETQAVKLRDASIFTFNNKLKVEVRFILHSPHGDDDVEFDLNGLITELTTNCDDVISALQKSFDENREGGEDEDDQKNFFREYAQSTAENLGYEIHKPLRIFK